MARVFEKLTPGGWEITNPNKLLNGDIIQVKDNDVVQGFAADAANGDPLLYIVASVHTKVSVPVRTLGGVRSQDIEFSDA